MEASRERTRRRRRRFGRIAALLVLLASAGYGAYYYLSEVPENVADDYRLRAEPAFERVGGTMERVFAAWVRRGR